MNEKLNSDKQLREKFDNFSVQPPPLVWDNIKGNLVMQRKRKRMAYLGWISAAAVVVLAFIGGWYLNNNTATENLKSAEQLIQNESNSEMIYSEKKIDNTIAEVLSEPENQNEEETEFSGGGNARVVNESQINTTSLNAIGSESSRNQQIEIEKIERKDVNFQQTANSNLLAEYVVSEESYSFTESDEIVMASNASNLRSERKTETGWKMGMHISPGYSSNVSNHSQDYSQNMNSSSDSGNGNIGGGFSIQYKTNKKLRIESGVYYAQNGQKSGMPNSNRRLSYSKDAVFAPPIYDSDNGRNNEYLSAAPAPSFSNSVQVSNGNLAMNSQAGVIEMKATPKGATITNSFESENYGFSNTLVSEGEFSQVFDFIEIPLYLRFSIIDSKFGLEIMGGLNAGVVVGNNAYIDNSYGVQNVGKTQDISSVNMSGTVGVGVNYDLGKHISVAVEPRLNYYLNSINQNAEVDFRPYRVGFYTGLYYDF